MNMKSTAPRKRRTALKALNLFRKGDVTFADFLEQIEDGQKADLLDGVIYMASPDNTEAADLQTWLAHLLHGFVEMKDLGKIYVSRVAYRIGPKRGPEPDLAFVPKEFEGKIKYGYIDAPPALAVEIVSPDSVQRDYVLKYSIYEEAGVREYWIIDPGDHKVSFLVLQRGKFVKAKPVRHIYKSEVLPGFEIDERWLLSKRRPMAYGVLRGLLGK